MEGESRENCQKEVRGFMEVLNKTPFRAEGAFTENQRKWKGKKKSGCLASH